MLVREIGKTVCCVELQSAVEIVQKLFPKLNNLIRVRANILVRGNLLFNHLLLLSFPNGHLEVHHGGSKRFNTSSATLLAIVNFTTYRSTHRHIVPSLGLVS